MEHAHIAVDLVTHGPDPEKDVRSRLALERALYIIGEAANSLTPETRNAIDQPWKRIIGLRVLLAHQYEVVKPATLRNIVHDHVPALIDAIRLHLD